MVGLECSEIKKEDRKETEAYPFPKCFLWAHGVVF